MTTVPPAFILSRDLPEDPKVDNYELCVAIAKVVGRGGLLGAQRIGALWRVYLNPSEARANLLRKGLAVRGIMVAVASQNPFLVKGPDGILIPGTRLTVSDIPLSIANATIEAALIKKGVKLRSALKLEEIRDREGKFTVWLSGRRFVFIDLPKTPLEKIMDIGPYKAKLFYREMPSTKKCFRCHKTGHTEAMCRTGLPDTETCSGTALVPQTKLSTPEIAEEENEQEEEKEEASKQSHDELNSNQAIIKLQKNEKEELPELGTHEHENMSSRKKKKMNKSSKRKKQP